MDARRSTPLRRTRPPRGRTAEDLVVGTVLGCVVSFLVLMVLFVLGLLLLPESVSDAHWIRTLATIASLLAGGSVAEWVMGWRKRGRWRRFTTRRTTAMQLRRCPECGYDLRGTIQPRCPECAEAFTAQEWEIALSVGGAEPVHDDMARGPD